MDVLKKNEGKSIDLSALLKKNGRLIVLAVAGVCLLFFGELFRDEKAGDAPAEPAQAQAAPVHSAEAELEERLSAMISCIEGAGKTRVMVTLENAGETVYACDERTDTQSADTERRQSYQNEHVFCDTQDGRQPLVETQLEPEIKGVAVVCEGGDDITVIRRITDLVSVVFGLPSNRVCVTKMIDTEEAS